MVWWLQLKFGRPGMHTIPVSAAEQPRLQNELLQQPVPQLVCMARMSMVIGIYPFEILHVCEWKSINWAPNDFSARGKRVVSLLTILPDPYCWYSPAGLAAPGMPLPCLLGTNFASVPNAAAGTRLGPQNTGSHLWPFPLIALA